MEPITLIYSNASPYARKVRMCCYGLDLQQQITPQLLHPLKDSEQVRELNPLGKVPALITASDGLIVNSPLICRYLDGIATAQGASSLLQLAAVPRLQVERIEALADGFTDAAFLLVMESLREVGMRSSYWQQRWRQSIVDTLEFLERDAFDVLSQDQLHLGQIAVAAGLGYLDFRLPQLAWRDNAPKLSWWLDDFSQWSAYQATAPTD